jgi:hypothetical protein
MQDPGYELPRISLPRTSVNRGWEEKPGLINTAAEQAGVSAEEAASGKPSRKFAEEAAGSAAEGASGTQEVSRKAPQEVPY